MVLEGKKGKNLQDLGLSENSLGQQSMNHKRKKKINKLNPIKIKTFALQEALLIG